ncbi:MAG: chorismate synthase [Phycisphaerae bacterium]
MARLTYSTAGESHGPALTALVEGLPAGVTVDLELINAELRRRQGGFGRGPRMRIEHDAATVLAGVRKGLSTGAPIVLQIPNRDSRLDETPPIHRPRPGHADLAGSVKWLTDDCRDTLERASARETAACVAAGALLKCLLREFQIESVGFVVSIGGVTIEELPLAASPVEIRARRDANEAFAPDGHAAERMIEAIREAKLARDTLGGIVEVRVFGVPVGLGSCASADARLDGRLMQALGAVQAIKGVEIGLGFAAASRRGSQVHDPIEFDATQRDGPSFGFARRSNHAGGIEGGMSNGQTIVVRAAMKPISTLLQGMDSVNLRTLTPERSDYERSDICAVPACSVVAENVVAFEIGRALLEKFGGDTLREVRAAYDAYRVMAKSLALRGAE